MFTNAVSLYFSPTELNVSDSSTVSYTLVSKNELKSIPLPILWKSLYKMLK